VANVAIYRKKPFPKMTMNYEPSAMNIQIGRGLNSLF